MCLVVIGLVGSLLFWKSSGVLFVLALGFLGYIVVYSVLVLF